MAQGVQNLTDSTFDMAVSKGISLVDFWATWCPPCRMQGPIIEELAKAMPENVMIGKLDVDANGATAAKFGVSSIPTLIIFKDGKEIKRFVGLQEEKDLAAAITDAQTA